MTTHNSYAMIISEFRDCRIHNGYCEHVCVMSWNGMGFCACHSGYGLARDLMNCDGRIMNFVFTFGLHMVSVLTSAFEQDMNANYDFVTKIIYSGFCTCTYPP